ncbi:MAG TPA: tetratricopeptide repeat protein, partial [Gaiellaceae bacterium]|nr:tetratricopeptide repeat protein [Gaiellaceae bacterium]
ENFRTAMAWLLEHRGADSLLLVLRLWRAWFGRGQLDEAERWVQAALEAGHDAPPRARAMMQGILGEFPRFRGEHERAIELKEAALCAARKIGDQRNVKALLCDMADSFAAIGELERADELAAEALAIEEGAGDPRQSRALATAAELAMLRNDYTEALRRYEQILEIIRPYQEEETSSYVWVMGCLGECFRKIGHEQNAIAAFREGIRAALDSRILTWLHYVLQGVAALAEPTEPHRGAVTLAASEATRSSMGLADDVGEYPKIEFALRARLGPSDFDAAYADGAALSIDEAAAYALETLDAISRDARVVTARES